MEKLTLIQVPTNSKGYFINNVGCLRYTITSGTVEISSCIEPQQIGIYLENNLHEIIGFAEYVQKKYIIVKTKI